MMAAAAPVRSSRCGITPALLVALSTIAVVGAAIGECPYDTKALKGKTEGAETKCLFLSDEMHSFTECQEAVCGPRNATLACVSSAEENELLGRWFATESALHPGKWGAWIGQYQEANEGAWRWTSTCRSTFSSWHPGEPNNYCMDEDCTMISPRMWGANWVDAACNVKAACICETGLALDAGYTYAATAELRASGTNYEACKEGEAAEARGTVRFTVELLLLLLILSSQCVLIAVGLMVYRRQQRYRPMLAEQALTQYRSLSDTHPLHQPLNA